MGTSAQLLIQSKPGACYLFRIGMRSDGSEGNLQYIAQQCVLTAKKLRVLTKWRRSNLEAVKKVLTEVVKNNNEWLFTANEGYAFISFTGVLDPATGSVKITDGDY